LSSKPAYGGQAVIEGVMFGGKVVQTTAIRRTNSEIEFYTVPISENKILKKLKKIPFLRGIAAIIESSAMGSKHLTFSAERYEIDPEEDAIIEENKPGKLTMIFGVAVIGVLSFLFSKFVFTLVPMFLADSLSFYISGKYQQIALEGLFKIVLLFGYIYFISLTPLVKRLFQYHGAEHKLINCYEHGDELTVENIKKYSRLHYRCGSSFMIFTIFVGVFLYLFFPTDPFVVRLASRIALIPVVLGISYEVLKWTNSCRENKYFKFLGYPGLWLQLLTTKEPTDDQIEVAIASFDEMLREERLLLEKNE
jgi:uncharacterized protein YqhQ